MRENIRIQTRAAWFSIKQAFLYVPKQTLYMALIYIVTATLPYGSSYLLGQLVDAIVLGVKNASLTNIWYLLLLYSLANGLPTVLSNLRNYIFRSWNLTFSDKLEMYMYRVRESIDIGHLENPKFQDLLQRAFRSSEGPIVNTVRSQLNILWDVSSFVIGTFLAIHFNSLIYLIVVASAVPGFIADLKFARSEWSIWSKDSPEQRRFSDLRYHISSKDALIETKLLQSGSKIINWMETILSAFTKKQLAHEKRKTLFTTFADIVAMVGFSTGLYMVVHQIIGGDAQVGSVVFMLSTLSNVRSSINSVLLDISGQYKDALIVNDMIEVFNTPPYIPESKNPIKLNLKSAPQITLENVSFKYPGSEKWSVRDLNMSFDFGGQFGLVGNNGAGKTTLVKLLCRIYDPTEGRILINGIDLKDVSIKEWWSYLGIMLQDYQKYDFLVKDAISISRSNKATNLTKVVQAARTSQAHEFIEEWDHKYNEQLGIEFKGKEPSKGQRQKLSIAKTLYRDGLVMILDEPTASVDAESESKIFDSIESLSKERIAILISHDFSTISNCDKIFILDRGQLIEEGTHKELMKKKGLYSQLYKLQAKRFKK